MVLAGFALGLKARLSMALGAPDTYSACTGLPADQGAKLTCSVPKVGSWLTPRWVIPTTSASVLHNVLFFSESHEEHAG